MVRSIEDLERIVRGQICRVCSDRRPDGSCGLDKPAECALFRLFAEVLIAVQTTHTDDIRDYIRAIRAKVCSRCELQAADGTCKTREEVRCALDAYLLLIVDAIDEAIGKFRRPPDFTSFVSFVPRVNQRGQT